MSSLLRYLETCKSKLLTSGLSRLHVVLGNEACDMDSVVCAVSMAYYLNNVQGENHSLVVPVLNIQSFDYQLRRETVYVLKKMNICKEHLIFRDNFNIQEAGKTCDLSLTLVDHHKLSAQDMSLTDKVVEIIDHRQIDADFTVDNTMTIELVGSCSTLVAEKLISDKRFKIPAEIAQLLYGTILVDTVCLSEQAGRTTQKDEALVTHLESILPGKDRKTLFEELQAAKSDISDLSNIDLLMKDLKIAGTAPLAIAFSSLPMEMQEFLVRPSLESDLRTFVDDQDVNAVILMTLHITEGGQACRELAVFCTDEILRVKVIDILKSSNNQLDLSSMSDWGVVNLFAFRQGDATKSRKKVLPIIQGFIRELKNNV